MGGLYRCRHSLLKSITSKGAAENPNLSCYHRAETESLMSTFLAAGCRQYDDIPIKNQCCGVRNVRVLHSKLHVNCSTALAAALFQAQQRKMCVPHSHSLRLKPELNSFEGEWSKEASCSYENFKNEKGNLACFKIRKCRMIILTMLSHLCTWSLSHL